MSNDLHLISEHTPVDLIAKQMLHSAAFSSRGSELMIISNPGHDMN